MFVERDFRVKQAQINDELRRRELERRLLLTNSASQTKTLRRGRQLVRQLLSVGGRTVPVTAPEIC